VPVVPVPLVATVVLNSGSAALSELEIKSRSFRLLQQLEEAGAHVYIPRRDRDYAVGVGLRMLTLRKMVQEQDGLYRIDPAHEPLLKYYAGSIRQFMDTTEET
jgi:glycerol-3-phosphate O-acyltransferase